VALEKMHAAVQYDDFTGTVALDGADFEGFEDVLGLEGWLPIGIQLYAVHPALGNQGRASHSGTYMKMWAIDRAKFRDDYSLPDLLAHERPVEVVEFAFDGRHDYPESSDPVGVLLRGSKLLDLIVWRQSVRDAKLSEDDFEVVDERFFVWENGSWSERRGEQ
jgi:hypothetical protein